MDTDIIRKIDTMALQIQSTYGIRPTKIYMGKKTKKELIEFINQYKMWFKEIGEEGKAMFRGMEVVDIDFDIDDYLMVV